MGIINRTPDSITDGNKNFDDNEAINNTQIMDNNVDIIDIGGMSTKPGHNTISESEELKRTIPFIKTISKNTKSILSIDSSNPKVIEEAILNGVSLINDVSGGNDGIFNIVKKYKKNYVLMCNKETNDIDQINTFFDKKIEYMIKLGIYRFQIILDPGCGFNKSSIKILNKIDILKNKKNKYPLLIGVSRKKFISNCIESTDENEIIRANLAVTCIAIAKRADIIRIHDVEQTKNIIKLCDLICR
jgi:dihydropteroate synthase